MNKKQKCHCSIYILWCTLICVVMRRDRALVLPHQIFRHGQTQCGQSSDLNWEKGIAKRMEEDKMLACSISAFVSLPVQASRQQHQSPWAWESRASFEKNDTSATLGRGACALKAMSFHMEHTLLLTDIPIVAGGRHTRDRDGSSVR